MVTIDLSATSAIAMLRARTASPLTWTVQAPHNATPSRKFYPFATPAPLRESTHRGGTSSATGESP